MNARHYLGCAFTIVLLAGCERPPIHSVQSGYRGTGMEQVYNPRKFEAKFDANQVPAPTPPVPASGQLASVAYKNVQVLGDLDVAAFTRLMVGLTNWVAPQEGCTYCHKQGEDLAADTLYTKVVSRKMLEMTRALNSQWKSHVGETGVTCYTCHRGQHIPSQVWFAALDSSRPLLGWSNLQNTPAKSVASASLPKDPFSPYFSSNGQVRILGTTALHSGHKASIQHTEWTYALMMHMSDSLGVNCTYCHNTRSFAEWSTSSPQRTTAWHGIRMVRDVNVKYLEPLGPVYPQARLGPNGDPPKANCATCHQGAYKPLLGAAMLKDYPELRGGRSGAPAAAAAPAPPPTAVLAPGSLLGKVLFETAKTNVGEDGMKVIESVREIVKDNQELKIDVSGFADKTGNPEQNLELAKQRAFAVRDALKAAGIPEDRINMRKPEFAIGGAVADARRVDVYAAQ